MQIEDYRIAKGPYFDPYFQHLRYHLCTRLGEHYAYLWGGNIYYTDVEGHTLDLSEVPPIVSQLGIYLLAPLTRFLRINWIFDHTPMIPLGYDSNGDSLPHDPAWDDILVPLATEYREYHRAFLPELVLVTESPYDRKGVALLSHEHKQAAIYFRVYTQRYLGIRSINRARVVRAYKLRSNVPLLPLIPTSDWPDSADLFREIKGF